MWHDLLDTTVSGLESPLREVVAGMLLGSDSFVERTKEWLHPTSHLVT